MNQPIQLKSWLIEEAERYHVGTTAIFMRLQRGQYPAVKLKHINDRVVFVLKTGEWQPHPRQSKFPSLIGLKGKQYTRQWRLTVRKQRV